MSDKIGVLFVCMGNICRSPMAEGIFQHMVKQAGIADKFKIDSAGTSRYHVGELAHIGTRTVLKKHNIPYNGVSRQYTPDDPKTFKYVVAMDTRNFIDMEQIAGKHENVTMFLSYANAEGTTTLIDTPDPYFTGKFDETYDLITKGCEALLAHIRDEEGI